MATAEQIAAQIAALKGLRANGYARVSYDGHTVEYRSLAEIDRAVGTGIKPSPLLDDAATKRAIQALWLAWTDEADAAQQAIDQTKS